MFHGNIFQERKEVEMSEITEEEITQRTTMFNLKLPWGKIALWAVLAWAAVSFISWLVKGPTGLIVMGPASLAAGSFIWAFFVRNKAEGKMRLVLFCLLPGGLFAVAALVWIVYDAVSHPQVVLQGEDCVLFETTFRELGVDSVNCADPMGAVQQFAQASYGGIGADEIYAALQADYKTPEQGLPTFENRLAEYVGAYVQTQATKFEVEAKTALTMAFVIIAIFTVGTAVNSFVPRIKGIGPQAIAGLIAFLGYFGWWWAGGLIAALASDAETASWQLYIAGAAFQSLVGSGLAYFVWQQLANGFQPKKKWQIVLGLITSSAGIVLGWPTVIEVFYFFSATNAVANTSLTMTQAGWSMICGFVTGLGIQTLVTSTIKLIRRASLPEPVALCS